MPDASRPSPPDCETCLYWAGQAAAADLLYNEQLRRADHLQQELSRLTDELRSVKRELSAAREERDIEQRRVNRLMAAEGEAA